MHAASSFVIRRLPAVRTVALGTHGRAVALGLAALADEALDSPNGYTGHKAGDVAQIVGLASTTVARWLLALETLGLVERGSAYGLWRISEAAFEAAQ